MPNISQNRLAFLGIEPGNQVDQMRQADANGCGACALLAAVASFHRFPAARAEIAFSLTDGDLVRNLSAVVDPGEDDFAGMARSVYRATGILCPRSDPPDDDDAGDFVESDGYNSPAALAAVAKQLSDLSVRVSVTRAGLAALGQLYPREQDRCSDIVGAQNVNTGAVYSAPTQKQVQLICVMPRQGLHWLARGSDGRYYDPADGSIENDWGDPDGNGNIGPYRFAGLWLDLSLAP